MNTKEIRYAVGKETYERTGPMKPIAEKYGVSIATIRLWMLVYMAKITFFQTRKVKSKIRKI